MATTGKLIERHICREVYVECDACKDQEMIDGLDDEDGVAAWCHRLAESGWESIGTALLCCTCAQNCKET